MRTVRFVFVAKGNLIMTSQIKYTSMMSIIFPFVASDIYVII